MSAITDLSPRPVWNYFDEITRIPRPSKKEEKIIAYLKDFAEKNRIESLVDRVGNVVMRKAATPGREADATVTLQAHMDMVCEKNNSVVFDFEKEAIRTVVKEGWVCAQGTTLGADCGIGMAAALAALTDSDLEHGPLEALFTVDEESGLTGAFALGEGMITGKYLINLDSEDEGEIFIGCAGGIDTVATFRYRPTPIAAGMLFFQLHIGGLKGGHSGDDIEKGRANSNRLLARFLRFGTRHFGLHLIRFDGGNLRNAIPREAVAQFALPKEKLQEMFSYFESYKRALLDEFHATEPGLDLTLAEAPAATMMVEDAVAHALLAALCAVPNGVLAMSASMPGLVESSSNLASVKFSGDDKIVVTTSQRSSLLSARNAAADAVEAVFELAGASVAHSDGYPGWNPNPKSFLLEVTQKVYFDLFGVQPRVRAIHAGLECGLFLEKFPRLEMVSFGPTLRGVHSPDECLEIASVDKFWRLLCSVISSIH